MHPVSKLHCNVDPGHIVKDPIDIIVEPGHIAVDPGNIVDIFHPLSCGLEFSQRLSLCIW